MCVSLFCQKMLLKMANIIQEIEKKHSYVRTGCVGGLSQKRTHAYMVGGLVKNVMNFSVRTLWMTPFSLMHQPSLHGS